MAAKGKGTPVLIPVRCAVCKQCWREEDTLRCIYNGPFDGYVEVKQQPKPPC
jgi:hypothetical protein